MLTSYQLHADEERLDSFSFKIPASEIFPENEMSNANIIKSDLHNNKPVYNFTKSSEVALAGIEAVSKLGLLSAKKCSTVENIVKIYYGVGTKNNGFGE